jgi:hypothetical protein
MEFAASELTVRDSRSETRIERARVSRLQVSRGRRSRWRRAGIGFLAGFAGGAITGLAASEDCHAKTGFGSCFNAAESAGFLGVFFGGVATAVGAIVPPAECWLDVPP